MKQQIVSFETAKSAKEKGFKIHCRNYYDPEIKELYENEDFPYNSYNDSLFAPTQSLLQKWLREQHGVHIIIEPEIMNGELLYYKNDIMQEKDLELVTNPIREFKTYEEALEDALYKSLTILHNKS